MIPSFKAACLRTLLPYSHGFGFILWQSDSVPTSYWQRGKCDFPVHSENVRPGNEKENAIFQESKMASLYWGYWQTYDENHRRKIWHGLKKTAMKVKTLWTRYHLYTYLWSVSLSGRPMLPTPTPCWKVPPALTHTDSPLPPSGNFPHPCGTSCSNHFMKRLKNIHIPSR